MRASSWSLKKRRLASLLSQKNARMIDAEESSRSKYQFSSKDSQLNQDCDCVSDDLADFVSHCTLLSIAENRMQHLNSGTRAGCVSNRVLSACTSNVS